MPQRVGLVGGLGPESTIDYYRRLLAAWADRFPGTSPPLVIDSLDAQYVLRLAASDHTTLASYMLESVQRLHGAGSDFAVLTSNTSHLVFDAVAQRSPIPLINIVDTCAEEAARLKFVRPGLIGARFTMESTALYPRAFARRGMEIVVPDEEDRTWVHDRYVNQLVRGEFRDDTRQEFVALISRLRESRAIDAIILGGTELPMLLRAPVIAGVPVLDTTGLHVSAIMDRLTSDRSGKA